jgi:uncharacterized protein with PQ loop repeat
MYIIESHIQVQHTNRLSYSILLFGTMDRYDILFIFYSYLIDELQLTSLAQFDYQMCTISALIGQVCKTMIIYYNNDFCSP